MIDGRPQRTWSQTATCRRLAGALSTRGIGDTVAVMGKPQKFLMREKMVSELDLEETSTA